MPFAYLLSFLLAIPLGLSGSTVLHAEAASPPFADAHIHYNWDQAEIISARAVVDKLKAAGVGLTMVSSVPSQLALELREAGGDWVIPFFSPYIHELGKRDWHLDQNVVSKAEQGLRAGQYFGIGEVHFMAGFKPRPENSVFQQLMALAKKYRVPALIHVDSANEKYFLGICKQHPQVKIIFAHAGGNLKPAHIRKILQQCDNVWVDFSARDPWRYGGLTDANSILLPEWKALVLSYPERFFTGTDPVWKVTRTQSWDQSDDGWDHYQQLFEYHQSWLKDLPEAVRDKIAWQNVRKLLQSAD